MYALVLWYRWTGWKSHHLGWFGLTDLHCNLLCGSVHVFVGMVSLTCVQFAAWVLRLCVLVLPMCRQHVVYIVFDLWICAFVANCGFACYVETLIGHIVFDMCQWTHLVECTSCVMHVFGS